MVLGIGLRLLDLNQARVVGLLSAVVLAPVATTPARLFRLPVGAGAMAGVVGRTRRRAGHKEAACG
jgi:hypothetical protein